LRPDCKGRKIILITDLSKRSQSSKKGDRLICTPIGITNKLLSPGPGIKAEIHDMLYGNRVKKNMGYLSLHKDCAKEMEGRVIPVGIY